MDNTEKDTKEKEHEDKPEGSQGRASFHTGSTTQGGSNYGQGSYQLSGNSYDQGDASNEGSNYKNEKDKLSELNDDKPAEENEEKDTVD